MITARHVQMALRKLISDSKLPPEEFADEAGVDRSTVYRIVGDADYAPKIETISALVESRELTLTDFFALIEGVTSPVKPLDQGSAANEGLNQGGRDVPASPVEPDRFSRLEAEVAHLKTQWGQMQTLAGSIVRELHARTQSGEATPRQSKRRGSNRKTG